MKLKINQKNKEFKKLEDIESINNKSKINQIELSDNQYVIVFSNKLCIQTITKYFNKSLSFKSEDKFYVFFEGKKENTDFSFEDFIFNLEASTEFFNYGTLMTYKIIPNKAIFEVKDIEFVETGKYGFDGDKRQWKCERHLLKDVKEYLTFNNKNEYLKEDLTLNEIKDFVWYLKNKLSITHKAKLKKILKNIIETNELNFNIEEALTLEIDKQLYKFIEHHYQQKAIKDKSEFTMPIRYSEILTLLNKNKQIIKMLSRGVNLDSIHESGLFYNLKQNIWIPFLKIEDIREMLQDLLFCKVEGTVYLLFENKFYTSENQIWKIILKTISINFNIELTETHKKEIMNRIEWLAEDNELEPCYRVKDIAILPTGKTEKFNFEKHFQFWSNDNHKKPTEQDKIDAEDLLTNYVKEENVEKLKTMLRYFFIPSSLGKKMFFIYSPKKNTGKTTFLENFGKNFFEFSKVPLSKIEENGSATQMNQIVQLEGEMSNNLYSSAISGKIKKKTGEKTLFSKNLFENSKSEYNFSKFVTTTNSIPNLKEENALFSKISIIEFGTDKMKMNANYFEENWHKVEALRRVIIQEVLENGQDVINTLLNKEPDKQDLLLIEESVKIYKFCKMTNTDPKNATYDNFILWLKDYEGERVTSPKKYCMSQIKILELEGIEINKNFFGHKLDENKKIDLTEFLVKKNK